MRKEVRKVYKVCKVYKVHKVRAFHRGTQSFARRDKEKIILFRPNPHTMSSPHVLSGDPVFISFVQKQEVTNYQRRESKERRLPDTIVKADCDKMKSHCSSQYKIYCSSL
jgi:hypothetical protein